MHRQVRIVCIIGLFWLLSAWPAAAAPEPDVNPVSREIAQTLSTESVNQFIETVNKELGEDIPLLNADRLQSIASQGIRMDWQAVWQGAVARLLGEFLANLGLMGKLLFLAVLCALLQNLHSSFNAAGVSLLAYSICFIFLMVLVLHAFYNVILVVRQSVDYMIGFMQAMLPLMLSLLAGVGAVTSVALFTPFMLFVIGITGVIVKDAVLPLLMITTLIECVNYLSDQYKLSNLAGVLKQSGMALLGLTLVVFIGVISIQTVVGGVTDGITLRTAKYATATFIPVVGKMFADTVELVMGASLLIKNAVGVAGVLAVGTVCTLPVVKLLSLIGVIKATGALVQPMGAERMAKCLDSVGNNLMLVLAAVLTVALMFFLSLTMLIGAGNLSMMLR
ncbi:MAG: stage III sporulation protein AE [Sporomusaceae bacterium]|nr:stage III sporulation protein AE [Sporomusaceae bacterium]